MDNLLLIMIKGPFKDLNAVVKKVELESLAKGHIYPVTIIADRYTGSYSGAKWLAFQLDEGDIPADISGGDPDCESFWRSHSDLLLPVGKGETPNEALEDLKDKAKKYYESWE